MNANLTQLPLTDPAFAIEIGNMQRSCWRQRLCISIYFPAEGQCRRPYGRVAGALDFFERPADVLLTLCRANGLILTHEDRHCHAVG